MDFHVITDTATGRSWEFPDFAWDSPVAHAVQSVNDLLRDADAVQ